MNRFLCVLLLAPILLALTVLRGKCLYPQPMAEASSTSKPKKVKKTKIQWTGPVPTPEEKAFAQNAADKAAEVCIAHGLNFPRSIRICLVRSPDQLVRVRYRWGPLWYVWYWKHKMPWKDVIYQYLSGYTLWPTRPTGYGGLWDGHTAFLCTFLGEAATHELIVHEILHAAKDQTGAFLSDGPVHDELESEISKGLP